MWIVCFKGLKTSTHTKKTPRYFQSVAWFRDKLHRGMFDIFNCRTKNAIIIKTVEQRGVFAGDKCVASDSSLHWLSLLFETRASVCEAGPWNMTVKQDKQRPGTGLPAGLRAFSLLFFFVKRQAVIFCFEDEAWECGGLGVRFSINDSSRQHPEWLSASPLILAACV